jgi:hypothetical protein
MTQETELVESNEPDVATSEWFPASKAGAEHENILLRNLFDKASGDDWDGAVVPDGQASASEGKTQGEVGNSAIGKLFDKIHKLDPDAETNIPPSTKPVDRITRTQIKALRARSAGEFEPVSIITEKCTSSVTSFWGSIFQTVQKFFPAKS